MRTLSLLTLAAGVALLPGTAFAQMHVRPPAGHGFHAGPNMTVRHGGHFMRGGFHHRRFQRGFIFPSFWFGPQFQVQNWQLYGFSPPPPRHRWVRHFDDAYLVDDGGRIVDTRYGLDWDEYGERWDMDGGIPHYYGRGDFHPDEEDYAWVEAQGGAGYADGWNYDDYGYSSAGDYDYGPPGPPPCHAGPPAPCGGYGYGAGYGYYGYYGYGVAYPIIVETTVTTGGCCMQQVVEEEVVQAPPPPRRHHRPRPRPRPAPPPPPPGERG